MNLPFPDTPTFLASLFTKKSQANLAWMITHQKIVVLLVGGIVTYILFRYDRNKAQINAIFIGVMAAVWGVAYKCVFCYLYDLSYKSIVMHPWIEYTDYLVIGLTIPIFAMIMNRSSQRIKTPSNNPLQPTASSGG